MIILDTNYLIAMVRRDRSAGEEIRGWLQRGESLATSAIAWAEFLNGPLGAGEVRRIDSLIEGRIVPFGAEEAACASRLYREASCRREHRLDTFIAATATVANGALATRNRRDFVRFVPLGLNLA
jgi:predicted nucleic acid-binding protein